MVIQRVSKASVSVDDKIVSKINQGFLLLVGITHEDDENTVKKMADKIVHMRIFSDDEQKMNRCLKDIDGEILSVSQFTLYADCKKGRRPSFIDAASPEIAHELYLKFNESLRSFGLSVPTGVFQTTMQVELINDGPVTIILDSSQL